MLSLYCNTGWSKSLPTDYPGIDDKKSSNFEKDQYDFIYPLIGGSITKCTTAKCKHMTIIWAQFVDYASEDDLIALYKHRVCMRMISVFINHHN